MVLARLLEAKAVAEGIREKIKQEVASLGFRPVLVSLMIGENAGAEAYVKSQGRLADELGIEFRFNKLPSAISQDELVDFIERLNRDDSVNGIIVQTPLPGQIDYKKVRRHISPDKDAEGINPANIGKVLLGQAKIIPCTASAVMELLDYSGIELRGKEVVVVGFSEIVGKPLACLLLERLATVSVCHIGTSEAGNLDKHVKEAEVLIVAVGKAGLVKGEWIKEGAVVVDVGINKVGDRIVGDVEFEPASRRASCITPVPGGVGPLTVTMLMRNLLEAAKDQKSAPRKE
ncbi:MAG: bifunctional 5,10-methylenetetrahydrofolate dehydrogenase/5,10-methenyltetrahydrofolate cyclohydrolase [Candidatus Omnitrophica bacterium]|jgi:methylenetetrahydrofolate dehydrogenase (NADP+)/methenyltetrahydrofolate cyclohydrolase|nr:bifunctional 5,10-methylenetetrahydrofolate dehydrogenase/5,10-methenyltetrahydrofolate cyclohydrolase [Candidatus Omnitrophota bacterium]MDD5500994.1 bifunctional 5,10-methylenetetrahydrofolate dehydrogenase/5,10-methenyltetrahydrofolate cyclohydrolase [Candidatus Omnitrophota bacterium]